MQIIQKPTNNTAGQVDILAPWVSEIQPASVSPGATQRISIKGGNYDCETRIELEGFTIDETSIERIGNYLIYCDVTAGATEGVHNVRLFNKNKSSVCYSSDSSVLSIIDNAFIDLRTYPLEELGLELTGGSHVFGTDTEGRKYAESAAGYRVTQDPLLGLKVSGTGSYWGSAYKISAFSWMKSDNKRLDLVLYREDSANFMAGIADAALDLDVVSNGVGYFKGFCAEYCLNETFGSHWGNNDQSRGLSHNQIAAPIAIPFGLVFEQSALFGSNILVQNLDNNWNNIQLLGSHECEMPDNVSVSKFCIYMLNPPTQSNHSLLGFKIS